METPAGGDRTQVTFDRKYYSEFTTLDWAFTVLTGISIVSLVVTYFKKAKLVQIFTDLQLDLTPFTKIALSSWYIPLTVLAPTVLLIWTLNPRTPLVTSGRYLMILTAFILNFAIYSSFCYAVRKPIKIALGTYAQSVVEKSQGSESPKQVTKKKSSTKRRR